MPELPRGIAGYTLEGGGRKESSRSIDVRASSVRSQTMYIKHTVVRLNRLQSHTMQSPTRPATQLYLHVLVPFIQQVDALDAVVCCRRRRRLRAHRGVQKKLRARKKKSGVLTEMCLPAFFLRTVSKTH